MYMSGCGYVCMSASEYEGARVITFDCFGWKGGELRRLGCNPGSCRGWLHRGFWA